jgi:hypothetical protein
VETKAAPPVTRRLLLTVSVSSEPTEKRMLDGLRRARARVEDRIRCAKDTGLENFPFHAFAHNEVWLELVLIAQDLFAWPHALTLNGELRLAEPKRLRHRLLHTAGRPVGSGRRTRLRLGVPPVSWTPER